MPDVPPIILWIDDEQEQLRLYSELLSRKGYRVLTATYASAALYLFERNQIDLVISDQRLRDCPGADVLAEMKRLKPNIPVILFTGQPQAPRGVEFADMFLTKGVATTEDLLASIAKLLQKGQRVPGSEHSA